MLIVAKFPILILSFTYNREFIETSGVNVVARVAPPIIALDGMLFAG